MPDKIKLDLLVFHITNVCNFNCDHCQTFSNYKFRGHQLWHDQKQTVKKWSEKLSAKKWQILGGEPMLNPSWQNWVTGLIELYPDVQGSISTNGSTIKYTEDFYNFFLNLKSNVIIRIQSHNLSKKKEYFEKIKTWLKSPLDIKRYNDEYCFETETNTWLTSYKNIKDPGWPECTNFDDCIKLPNHILDECQHVFNMPDPRTLEDNFYGYLIIDANNIKVTIQNSNIFGASALIPSADQNSLQLYNSDPKKAHDVCISKSCQTITNGKWYKCHTTAHLEEFTNQFNVNFTTPEDLQLISNIKSADADMSIEELNNWLQESENYIPQCKFCPEKMTYNTIQASTKKINFLRKKQI